MKKFSVIIPTIWNGPWIIELLNNFCISDYIDEIILIDNNPYVYKHDEKLHFPPNEKIKYFPQETNLYVNPSWNLGVSLAKNENVIIANDDIIFNVDGYCKYLSELGDLKQYGIIGVNSDNYSLEHDIAISLNAYGAVKNTGGWACLLAFHRDTWVPIPEQIKIYYGDNFLQMVCSPILELKGIAIKTIMSSSANTSIEWVKQITNNDLKEWYNILGMQ